MMSKKDFDIEYNANTAVNEIKTAISKTEKVTQSISKIQRRSNNTGGEKRQPNTVFAL